MQKVFRVNLTKIRDMAEIFTIFALIANLVEGLLKLGTKGPHPSTETRRRRMESSELLLRNITLDYIIAKIQQQKNITSIGSQAARVFSS